MIIDLTLTAIAEQLKIRDIQEQLAVCANDPNLVISLSHIFSYTKEELEECRER